MEGIEDASKCIFTFNNRGFIGYLVMKDYFNLSDRDVYNLISEDFDLLLRRLEMKRIPYNDLKGALIPNQKRNVYEICLVIDWSSVKI